jgi:hypothetical protein
VTILPDGGVVVGDRYLPPIAGAEGEPAGEGDKGQQSENPAEGNGSPGDKPKPDTEPKFSQADLDRIVAERLQRAQAKADSDAAKARREAEEAAAAEKGEYQKLAEQRAQRITALEAQVAEAGTVQQRADRLEAALTAHLTAQRKGIEDKGVLELLDKLDAADQLEWIAKHGATAAGGQRPGIPASPRPNGHRPEQKADLAYDRMKAAGLGRGF